MTNGMVIHRQTISSVDTMKERARELVQEAKEARKQGALTRAGNCYTAAAHEYMGTVTSHTFPEPDLTRAAVSECCFAALSYRIAGDDARVQNRCELGTVLATDYERYIDLQEVDPESFAALRRGAWQEFIGDLRIIARRDDAADAYDRASEIYDAAGDYELAIGEQEHMRLTGFLYDVRTGLGHEPNSDEDLELRPLGPTFTDWIEYKRERLPQYLLQLEAQDNWPVNAGPAR